MEMKRWWTGWGAVACLLACAGAQAQVSEAQAQQLMQLSGQWEQLALIATQMREGLVQGLAAGDKAPPADVQARVKLAADKAFAVDAMRGEARGAVAQNVRAGYLPELLRWYEGGLARRVTQAEVDDTARAGEDMKARTMRGVAIVRAASAERQGLLLRLVEVTRAPRVSADMIINMGVVLPLALLRFDPQARRTSEAELRSALEEQRGQLILAFETINLASFAITYRDLPDEALAAYADFMASAAGEHYTDIGERAFEAAILASIAALRP